MVIGETVFAHEADGGATIVHIDGTSYTLHPFRKEKRWCGMDQGFRKVRSNTTVVVDKTDLMTQAEFNYAHWKGDVGPGYELKRLIKSAPL